MIYLLMAQKECLLFCVTFALDLLQNTAVFLYLIVRAENVPQTWCFLRVPQRVWGILGAQHRSNQRHDKSK